ncbi:DUF1707 domain-containing protein [Blastococcus sp. CT_GayMR16]|uniref:DUF1707 SHOCT-like domain-containing protein n=1 Tax=Blastococcus sp. CT_GayMR16 TaxID=2559607 RepID=UPI001072EEA9|nr:DUF1707 domain-containing protein [Blastococcus sp. CT_GayMR16]TFV87381.1 DUF1707 domain-containing protein [Blastococcus sp. CT_GayMR16]
MSSDRELVRVSDAERQAAADRLRAALGEGRLDLLEYDNRLALAYSAVTYRDLDQLFTDLPVHAAAPSVPVAAARPVPPTKPVRPVAVRSGAAGLPLALKILWGIWGMVVAINLTVWLLVSLGNGEPEYFWPMWLFVPGVALLGGTAVVQAVRSNK